MRIIAGTHKGRKINFTNNLNLRPTTDKAKEAIFSMIESRYLLDSKNMLDLFSGTGNIAYEFASRGVDEVLALDSNIKSVNFIKKKSKEFKLNISVIHSEALKYTKNCKRCFNFIFADPPYNFTKYQELKNNIIEYNLVKDDGLLIIEHDKNTKFNDSVEIRKYGSVHFSIFTF